MKRIAIAAAALPLIFGPALAQGIHIGPRGVDVNVGARGGTVWSANIRMMTVAWCGSCAIVRPMAIW